MKRAAPSQAVPEGAYHTTFIVLASQHNVKAFFQRRVKAFFQRRVIGRNFFR